LGPFSFTVTLATCIGALVALAVLAVLAIQWRVSREATMELLHGKATGLLGHIESSLRVHLEPAEDLAEFVAARIESGAVPLDDEARLADLLTGSLAAVPHLTSVVVFGLDHRMFGVRRAQGAAGQGEVALRRLEQSGNPAVARAFAEIGSTAGAFWGEPVVTADGLGVINLRRALRRDGELIGMLVAAITIPELSELVTEAGDRFGGTAFVLYGRDRVLAHPNLVAIKREAGADDDPTAGLGQVGDLVLASLWEGRPVPMFRDAPGAAEVVRVTLGAESYVALYTWTNDFGAVPWALGAWFQMEGMSAEMERLMLAGLGGLGVLLLGLLAAVLLGRGIARPVKRIAAGVQRIGELELAEVERLPPSMIRELDEQSRAFNAMVTSLRAFETYVPRKLVERLVQGSDAAGGEGTVESVERELTVMFTDIVGFTAMSEGMPAAELARFLDDHFALLGACVEAEGGTVDKFIGDAIMAFWGAPEKQKDRALRACRAALAMATALEADNARRAVAGLAPVRLRIGIHTGPVVVGNIGWPGRINYTIVGDTVNTCQRLEALGKEMDRGEAVTILIGGSTAERLDASFKVEPAGRFEVRGKAEPLEVFRLLPWTAAVTSGDRGSGGAVK
jgi:class 3 adenylate cyclase